MSAIDLKGKRVRLLAFDLEKDTEAMARWDRETEYMRLLDTGPHFPTAPASNRAFMEKEIGEKMLLLAIRPLDEDRTIGFLDLAGFDWHARSAWVGIGIGEPEFRGKGYGSDAMNVLARYAFQQLNLNRINLTVFGYNPRAIRSYEKVGFVHEGSERQWLNREGQRWDMLYMGLLREDWLALQKTA